MKKSLKALAFLSLLIGFGLSCSVFEPDTSIGSDIIKTVDSTVIDLKTGFAKLDSVNLAVSGARSVVVAGADTSILRLQSGVHGAQIVAGRIGDDSAVAYAEFQVSSTILTSLRAACSTSKVDSVYLLLHYNPTINDTTLKVLKDSMVTVQAFSCQRKFFRGVRNDFSTPDGIASPPLTFSRRKVDTVFAVPLGGDMVSFLNQAVKEDTATYLPHIAESDTTIGWRKSDSTRPVRPDTEFIKDSVLQSFADTLANVRTVGGLKDTMRGDTAIFSYMADSMTKADTLLFTRSIIGVGDTILQLDTSAIVKYSVLRERTITRRLVYDSTYKYIGAVHIYASAGGGVVRFLGPPSFLIKYRANCADTARQAPTNSNTGYFDMTVTEAGVIPSDSLVASWQADRFVEIPIDLTPIWNFGSGGGNGRTYNIIQNATCFLNASLPEIEMVGTDTTQRKIVYGLLDHQITDSRAHSIATRDSLTGLLNAGRLANDSVTVAPSRISLPVTIFLQSIYEENPRPPKAYLYVFVRTANDFGRVVIQKPSTVRFTALFSNPRK